MARNYFRVGGGKTARYFFFNDNDHFELGAAWERAATCRVRLESGLMETIGVWHDPPTPGPWMREASVIEGEHAREYGAQRRAEATQ